MTDPMKLLHALTEPRNSVIWKFTLTYPRIGLDMPVGAHVLAVGQQSGMVVLWAAVDPEVRTERRIFQAVGTGADLPSPAVYHGTVQMPGGLVWHILEEA